MTSLKKALKRARLFEVQKIIKRLRSLEGKRGTERQVKKNQRKAQRLQYELELIKDVDITDLCRRIEANDEDIVQLTQQEQPPAKLDDRAEWRLLTSRTVSNVIMITVCDSGTSDEYACRLGCDNTLNRASPRSSAVLVEHPKDDLHSVFLTSLSASSNGAPPKKRMNVARRNRLGQRARRNLWKQKYGSKAKHLTMKRKRTPAKSSTFKQLKSAKQAAEGEKRSKDDLHPSWAAKKQLKTGIKDFQGQKIVFDSD